MKHEEMSDAEAMDLLAQLAAVAGGHFTVMKFTTNWRVSLGTLSDVEQIEGMAVGSSLGEATRELLGRLSYHYEGEFEGDAFVAFANDQPWGVMPRKPKTTHATGGNSIWG